MTLGDYMKLKHPEPKAANLSLDSQYESIKSSLKVKRYKLTDGTLIAHVRIPSRKAMHVSYDVVFEFMPETSGAKHVKLSDTPLKCFSNCPSFVYRYAAKFYKDGLLCAWLRDRYERESLEQPKKTATPVELMAERSLYIAAKHLTQPTSNITALFAMSASAVNSTRFINLSVKKQKDIDEQYTADIKHSRVKPEATESKKTSSVDGPKRLHRSPSNDTVKYSNLSGTTKTSAKTKKSSKIKKI